MAQRFPRKIPRGRVIVHNHVRPVGFPDVGQGQDGFRFWSDVRKPEYTVCDCRWAPQLRWHYRVRI
jgi:hypothetical protein